MLNVVDSTAMIVFVIFMSGIVAKKEHRKRKFGQDTLVFLKKGFRCIFFSGFRFVLSSTFVSIRKQKKFLFLFISITESLR